MTQVYNDREFLRINKQEDFFRELPQKLLSLSALFQLLSISIQFQLVNNWKKTSLEVKVFN